MYGYLTLEDAEKFYEQGFCIILDGDSQEALIKNDELEYAEYLLSITDFPSLFQSVAEAFGNVVPTLVSAIKNICMTVGQALIKIGSDE